MFIGHYALGFASGKLKDPPSLALMFIAVQLLDLLWPVFVLVGLERLQIDPGNTKLTPLDFTYYPYSHSLLMATVWSLLFGGVYWLYKRNRRNAVLLGILVFSHWILDFLSHRPDLPLTPFTDAKVGLGLWNLPIWEILLEMGLFLFGAAVYYKYRKPPRKLAFWFLIIFFTGIHLMNLLGPPPPSTLAVAWSANLMWLFVLWAWWIEKEKKASSKTVLQ